MTAPQRRTVRTSVESRMIGGPPRDRTMVGEVARALGVYGAVYLAATLGLVAVHFRLVIDKQNKTIDDTALFAGVMCGMAAPFLVYLASAAGDSRSFADRSRGLPTTALVIVVVESVLAVVGLILWRPIIGGDAPPGSVYDTITSSPLAWAFVVALSMAINAWSHAFCLPFFSSAVGLGLRLWVFLPLWIGSFFLWPLLAVTLLARPPRMELVAYVGALALVLIAVMLLVLTLVQREGE